MKKANQIVSIGLDFKDFEVDNVDYLDFLSTTGSIKEGHKIILYFPRFSNYQECSNKEEIIGYWKKELGKARSENKHIVVFLFEPWQFVDEGMETLELIEGFFLEKPKISYSSNVVLSNQKEFLNQYWKCAKDTSYALMSFEGSRDYTEIFSMPQQGMVGCLSNDNKILFLPLCDIEQIVKNDFISIIPNIESIAMPSKGDEEKKEKTEIGFGKKLEEEVKGMLKGLGFQLHEVDDGNCYDLDFDIKGKHFIGEVKSSRVRIEHLVKFKNEWKKKKEEGLKAVLFADSSRWEPKQIFFSPTILDFARQEGILLVDIYELKILMKFLEGQRKAEREGLRQEIIEEFKKTESGKVRLLYDDIQATKQEKISKEEVAREEWWKNAKNVFPMLSSQEKKSLVVQLLKEYASMLDTQYDIIALDEDFQKIRNIFLAYIFNVFYKNFQEREKLICIENIRNICVPYTLFFDILGYTGFVFRKCSFNLLQSRCTENKQQIEPYLYFEECEFFSKLVFKNLVFDMKVKFLSCQFRETVIFSGVHFKQDVFFQSSSFYKNADFHETTFDKYACFYGVAFETPPFFNQALFKEKLNLVNAELDFSFEECRGFITDDLTPTALRDSFRVLKGKLIDVHNLFDSSMCRKMELYFKEFEINKELGATKKDTSIKRAIHRKAKKMCLGVQKMIKKIKNCNPFHKAPQFAEQKLLAFYRTISDHHTNLSKSFSSVVFYIVFNCLFLVLMKYVFTRYFLIGSSEEMDAIAKILIRTFLIGIIGSLLGVICCKGIRRVIALCCFCLFALFLFAIPLFLEMHNTFFVLPFVMGTIVFYFSLMYVYFYLLEIRAIRLIASVFLYFLFVVFFCHNPYIVAPVLENSDKSEIYNYFVKEYIQNTDLNRLKGVVQRCEKLDRQIDWSGNQYSQIKQVLLSDSVIFLTDEICANETNLDLSIIVFKNWVFNNVLKVIHVVYSIILALFVFSLIKTARKNSIVPS